MIGVGETWCWLSDTEKHPLELDRTNLKNYWRLMILVKCGSYNDGTFWGVLKEVEEQT